MTMTLIDQLKAARAHREVDAKNYETQVEFAERNHVLQLAFLADQKTDAMAAHDKRVAGLEELIEAHKVFIGGPVEVEL